MPPGLELPEGWKGAFLAAIGRGDTIEAAAGAADIGVSTVYAQKQRDQEFAAEWDAAKRIRTERRRDWVIDKLHAIAESDDHKAQFAALSKLFDALPENRTRDVNLGLDVSGQVEVVHEARLTLATVLGLASRLGLSSGARGELPAAPEVLAPPPPG